MQYDAIVVGSGISGGWAAKELTEKGLKVLVLERGNPLEHQSGYKYALMAPWELPHHGRLSNELKAKFPIQSSEGNYPITEANQDFWADENKNPYVQEKPFDWYRGATVGGKSLTWGRQVYRWSDIDFEANAKEGIGTDWPIRYKDLEPWYDYVEKFIGVSGQKEGLAHLPDGIFQPAMELNCVEKELKNKIKNYYGQDRMVTIGRVAHLTDPTPEQLALGRGSCQYRNACSNGCPYGAYFSSLSATLPAANKTKNLTIRPNTIVRKLLIDKKTKKAIGVECIDDTTLEVSEINAKIIFLCASTVGSTQILLNSEMDESSQLGKNLMDHHSRAGASASVEDFEDMYFYGRRANGLFIPRYRNIGNDKRDYVRGFDYQGGASRRKNVSPDEFGPSFKKNSTELGPWNIGMNAFGECLPYESNRMELHKTLKDNYGMPLITFNAQFQQNEWAMRKDMVNDAAEMLEKAGFKNIKTNEKKDIHIGLSKHEMGTARMGTNSKNSVLNKHNQVWACQNVFVTDGAAMASSSCVNPSLTYMALTARACDYAVSELKKMNL